MQKARVFLILGVWIAVLPHLGFPYSWKNVLYTLTGLAVIYLSYTMYQEYRRGHAEEFDNFRENTVRNKKVKITTAVVEEEVETEKIEQTD